MDWQRPRTTYSVGLMTAVAVGQGVTLAQCLDGSGIEPAALQDPHAEVLPRQELVVIGNIVRHLREVPALGLTVGQQFHMSVYGTLAFVMTSSATIGAGIEIGLRYGRDLFTLTEKAFRVEGDELVVAFDDSALPRDLAPFIAERDVAAMVNNSWEIFVRTPLRRVAFRFPRPRYGDQFKAFFGVEPEFGAERHLVAVDRALLDQPTPQASVAALRFWEMQLQASLTRRKARSGMAAQVRDMMLRQPAWTADMEAIASRLCMTSRNLRRRLALEATSFRGLVEEVRQAVAEELLTTPRLSMEEVADRLGYNDVSSFGIAFKRWNGIPPGEWRAQHRPRLLRHGVPTAT